MQPALALRSSVKRSSPGAVMKVLRELGAPAQPSIDRQRGRR